MLLFFPMNSEMDWTLIASLGALVVSIVVIFSRLFDKSLSLREHEEFRRAVSSALDNLSSIQRTKLDVKSFDDWREQFRDELKVMMENNRHDHDRIEEMIRMLDRAKPTTDELKTAAESLKERIILLERGSS